MSRIRGTVKWFNESKGYGFICSPGMDDVFVHYTQIDCEGYKRLTEGDEVLFTLSPTSRPRTALQVRRSLDPSEEKVMSKERCLACLYSGVDDAEYRANGCPPCICTPAPADPGGVEEEAEEKAYAYCAREQHPTGFSGYRQGYIDGSSAAQARADEELKEANRCTHVAIHQHAEIGMHQKSGMQYMEAARELKEKLARAEAVIDQAIDDLQVGYNETALHNLKAYGEQK